MRRSSKLSSCPSPRSGLSREESRSENPLKNVRALKDIAGVMVNGVWMPDEELEERLDELAARWVE